MSRQFTVLSAQCGALLVALCWWVWSFTQTDPNLYYSSNSFWVNFQQFMWSIPRPTVVWIYIGMVVASFVIYIYSIGSKGSIAGKKWIPIFSAICILLITSNNALSHDMYNYMFNAKAVAIYHQDPHVLSALEIAPQDDWVRFMHNVHTTAPYGHFWTYITLLPFYAGIGKFLTTFLEFKLFIAAGLGILTFIQWQMLENKRNVFFFLLNPLVLIEGLMNGHNDVWMMVFAMASFYLLFKTKKNLSWLIAVSFLFLILSTQVKEATLVLFPLWFLLVSSHLKFPPVFSQFLDKWSKYWAEIAAILLFLPLFIERSQQFNPWYLVWSLTFLPFIHIKFIKNLLISFSLTSLLRYVPFLIVGGYSDTVQLHMRIVTWSAVLIASMVWMWIKQRQHKNEK